MSAQMSMRGEVVLYLREADRKKPGSPEERLALSCARTLALCDIADALREIAEVLGRVEPAP